MRYGRLLSALLRSLRVALAGDGGSKETGEECDGMAWIRCGEFSMGAVASGHGSGKMPMPSNDGGTAVKDGDYS
jgi:hypothetical protein